MDCLFCKIIAGKIPSQKVYDDETVYGFKDISPQAATHYLFVPKEHFDSLVEVPANRSALLGQLVLAAKNTAEEIGIAKNGYRLVMNTNPQGGQTVFHVHLHLIGGEQLGGNMSGLRSKT